VIITIIGVELLLLVEASTHHVVVVAHVVRHVRLAVQSTHALLCVRLSASAALWVISQVKVRLLLAIALLMLLVLVLVVIKEHAPREARVQGQLVLHLHLLLLLVLQLLLLIC